MPASARVLQFDVAIDATGDAHSALGGSTFRKEAEWWAEHLVLAGLVRCTLASMDYAAHRAGMEVRSSGTAHGEVTKREADDLYAFVGIETALDIELDPPPSADAVRQLVAKAERGCFVSNSLTARPRHRWVVNGQEVT